MIHKKQRRGDLARRLKAARVAAGYASAEQAAKHLAFGPRTIRKFEADVCPAPTSCASSPYSTT